jgi:hypothetical protein
MTSATTKDSKEHNHTTKDTHPTTPTSDEAAASAEAAQPAPTELRCKTCGRMHTKDDWEYRSGNCHSCGAVLNIPGNVWKPDTKPLTLEQVQAILTPEELRLLAEAQKNPPPKVPTPPEPPLTKEQEAEKSAFGGWKPGPPFEAERQSLITEAAAIAAKLERAKFDPPQPPTPAPTGANPSAPIALPTHTDPQGHPITQPTADGETESNSSPSKKKH